MLSGLHNPKIFNILVWRFCVVTPTLVTSAGKSEVAVETRFCTFTAAISGSEPCLKYTVIRALPVLVAVEVMYVMFSTPLMASSNGTITDFCTVSALAPAYEVDTLMVGGAISGYCSIGSEKRPIKPTIRITAEMTIDNIGRSINVFRFILIQLLG